MKAAIKSITLENFKGVKQATYAFGNNASITGCNGAGKSTIATAWYWIFGNVDSELTNNPNVFPNDMEEATPAATAVLDIDGTEVTVARLQKRKITKSKEEGKADSVTVSSTYKVNEVEYGERDFKKKMESYGVDMEKFLQLSHPDVFTSQMANKKDLEKMRNTLFSMGGSYTDLEVAEQTDGVSEAKELLKSYSKQEIEAMQNATLRKIREVYGLKGEILRATIEGMERSKTDIDLAELELHRNLLKEQIADNKAKQENISKQYNEQQKASDGILELKFRLSDLHRKANEENTRNRREIEDAIRRDEREASLTEKTVCEIENSIKFRESIVSDDTLEQCRKEYTEARNREFDENSLICSYCGQEYPAEKKEQLRAKFQSDKQEELRRITAVGNAIKERKQNEKKELENLKKMLEAKSGELRTRRDAIAERKKQLSELPEAIDISDTPEAQEIQKQIAEKEAAMNKSSSVDEVRMLLRANEEHFREELAEVEKRIALSIRNAEIDEQISELREKQGEYEQNKANAEKVLDQLSMIDRRKNELLSDSINQHFEIVEWLMFDWQKNGEYKSVCIPLIDGRRFGESANTGREILAKMDIINGLQRFYGQHLPIFLDNAEALDKESVKRIKADAQAIFLTVTNDRDLKVEASQ